MSATAPLVTPPVATPQIAAAKLEGKRKARLDVSSTAVKLIEIMASVATIIGVIGVIAGLMQWREQVEVSRTDKALELLDVWEERDFKELFDSVSADLAVRIARMTPEERDAIASAGRSDRIGILGNVGASYLQETTGKFQVDDRIDRLFYFFTRLAICVRQKLCSESATAAFFDEAASTFWQYFNQYAVWRRSNYASFGKDFENYVVERL